MSFSFKIFLFSTFLCQIFSVNRVLLIGLDGLNPSCLKDTSYFDYFLQNGSYTFTAKSTYEAWSSTGWSSLLCSLDSSDTGIFDNSWVPSWLKSDKSQKTITAVEGETQPFTCIFETIKTQKRNYRTGFYYDWDWLEYFGNKYIMGKYIDDEFSCRDGDFSECDEIIKKLFHEKVERIWVGSKEDFEFFFLYLGAIDYMGHTKGWCGSEYMFSIANVDMYIREILKVMEEKNILKDTYIMLTSDHGASIGAFNHGEQNDDNLFVPFFVMGPGVRKNYEIMGNVHLLDVAPTVVKMLRLKKYQKWRGKAVMEIFEQPEDDAFLEKCEDPENEL